MLLHLTFGLERKKSSPPFLCYPLMEKTVLIVESHILAQHFSTDRLIQSADSETRGKLMKLHLDE